MLELKGIESIEPSDFIPNQEQVIEIESLKEHLIILRRVESNCSFRL